MAHRRRISSMRTIRQLDGEQQQQQQQQHKLHFESEQCHYQNQQQRQQQKQQYKQQQQQQQQQQHTRQHLVYKHSSSSDMRSDSASALDDNTGGENRKIESFRSQEAVVCLS